jgi:hypothetical protein
MGKVPWSRSQLSHQFRTSCHSHTVDYKRRQAAALPATVKVITKEVWFGAESSLSACGAA